MRFGTLAASLTTLTILGVLFWNNYYYKYGLVRRFPFSCLS